MKGILKKIDLVTRQKKNGGTFKQIVMTVDCITDEEKKTIKTRKAYLSEEYAKKYAKYCNLTSQEMIGKSVIVTLEKRMYEKDGVEKVAENIRYVNFIDENGNPIIMIDENKESLGF
jgi:hypothetical protein